MRNTVLTFFLLIISGLSCHSQSFILADDAGPLANGSDVFQSGPSDTLQLITWLHLTNISSNTLRVMMKKEEISLLPGTNSSICWAGYCYGPEMTSSTFPLVMLPGELASGCFAHYGPGGCRGVSTIRWTFFNEANAADSVSITVRYSTFPSGLDNTPDQRFSLVAAGAVPADLQIAMRYSLPPGIPGRIHLYNTSGSLVSAGKPVTQAGITIFAANELPSGVYFCSLMIGDRPVQTRKILVCHGSTR